MPINIEEFSLFCDFLQKIRLFFSEHSYKEVPVSPLVEHPGMEVHIHPFKVEKTSLYLQTSPEFSMKWLLSCGMDKIFTLGHSFRNEPKSPIHRPDFLLLEWYRKKAILQDFIEETKNLISFVADKEIRIAQYTVQEVFQEYVNFDILNFLTTDDLLEKVKCDFPEVPLPQKSHELPYEDIFFLLFLNKIEPFFEQLEPFALTHWPRPLAALSQIDKNDPRVALRFEIYIKGIEICNCFQELTDYEEQKNRALHDQNAKKEIYGYDLGSPRVLLESLKQGLENCCGNALGVERLYSLLSNKKSSFFFIG